MFVRKVRTASGAVAVQVARRGRGRDEIVKHVGSARTDAELGILLERVNAIIAADQGMFEFVVPRRTARVDQVADWRPGAGVADDAQAVVSTAGAGCPTRQFNVIRLRSGPVGTAI